MLQQTFPEPVSHAASQAAASDRRLGARDVGLFGRRYAALVLVCIAVALSAGELYVVKPAPTYVASTQVVIEPRRGSWSGTGSDASFAQYSLDSSQIENQIQIIKSEQISRRVVRGLGLEDDAELAQPEPSFLSGLRAWFVDDAQSPRAPDSPVARIRALADRVSARRIGQSYVIEISCWSRDPERAARVCNAVTGAYIGDLLQAKIDIAQGGNEILAQRIADLRAQREAADAIVNTGVFRGESFPSADARVITTAAPPEARSWPRNSLVLAFSGLLGLFAGLLAAAIHRGLDASIESADQAEFALGSEVLGSLPRVGLARFRGRSLDREVSRRPSSRFSAAVRQARTSIQLRQGNNALVSIGITSTIRGEGKATLATNLARAMASAGGRVLVIDANLRDARLTRACRRESAGSLVDVLEGARPLDRAVVHGCVGRADLLPSLRDEKWVTHGHLLASPPMIELLAVCRQRYDTVLVVLPALEAAPDARAIAPHLDGMVLVVQCRRLGADRIAAGLRSLRQASDNVLGIVLVKAAGRRC